MNQKENVMLKIVLYDSCLSHSSYADATEQRNALLAIAVYWRSAGKTEQVPKKARMKKPAC